MSYGIDISAAVFTIDPERDAEEITRTGGEYVALVPDYGGYYVWFVYKEPHSPQVIYYDAAHSRQARDCYDCGATNMTIEQGRPHD